MTSANNFVYIWDQCGYKRYAKHTDQYKVVCTRTLSIKIAEHEERRINKYYKEGHLYVRMSVPYPCFLCVAKHRENVYIVDWAMLLKVYYIEQIVLFK